MKFKDTVIGCIIETENPLVIEQFKKHSAKYQEIKKKESRITAETKAVKD
jgi:hypothetical protein